MAAPFEVFPADIEKVDALIEWLEDATPISKEEVEVRQEAFRKSTQIDWIGLRNADLTLEEAVANGRTDLVGARMLLAIRDKPDSIITRGNLEDIGTEPWPITDIFSSGYSSHKEILRDIKQDLGIQCDFVQTFFSRHFQIGSVGITYYVWRVFVLLRKAKELERELRFLSAVCRHKAANVCPEDRMKKLVARLQKKGIVPKHRPALPAYPKELASGFPWLDGIRQARIDFDQGVFRPDDIVSSLYRQKSERQSFVSAYRMEYYELQGDPDPVGRAFGISDL